jgi:hypothetical protein
MREFKVSTRYYTFVTKLCSVSKEGCFISLLAQWFLQVESKTDKHKNYTRDLACLQSDLDQEYMITTSSCSISISQIHLIYYKHEKITAI